uniref:Leukocyte cell-derived chemotaxin 2 n=1 Tax=Sardinops melanosticta TaxID=41697 RepID=F5HRF7_9TELE|nr:leukocyte cell-derived chemotaxin 2 [Sardinops melanostictus]
MKVAIILAILVSTECSLVKFGPLCSGNPTNQARGCDVKWGCGNYGAKRGHGTHKGLDIKCSDEATVYAPFDVELKGQAAPYRSPTDLQKLINDGVNVSGEGLCFKLFYVKPDKYSGSLKKDERIGKLLPMQRTYPKITSHIHVQMCDRSDPTKYF